MKKRIIAVLLVMLMVFLLAGCDSMDYKEAMELFDAGRYSAAEAMFRDLGDYEDSAKMVKRCRYEIAKEQYANGDYKGAAAEFAALGDFKDSQEMVRKAKFQILREYVLENGEALSEGYMITTTYDDAALGISVSDDEDWIQLAYYSETDILATFTYVMFLDITLGEDEATLVAEHDMDMYYNGSYAYSEKDYEAVLSLSAFTRTSRITLVDYSENAMNIYGGVTNDTNISNAPVEDLHTHLYTMIEGIDSYLEDNNVGVSIQDLGFTSWE